MRRLRALVLGLALVLVLAGCAGLPTSGAVNAGRSDAGAAGEVLPEFRPDYPQPGASPQQIVQGFITAASSPEGGWAIAQSFLSNDFKATWKPQAGVVVDVFASRQYQATDDGTVTVSATPVATVDASGTYTAEQQGSTPFVYRLAQGEDQQWRIVEAPAGLMMDEDLFANVFRPYELMYFDPTWSYLVPDLRWFPTLNAPGRIANALVNGSPSAWLADSVRTAFPDNVELTPSVPVSGTGIATAELSEQALAADDATLDRMQTQLQESLRTANVSGVQMLVDGTVLGAGRAPTTVPRIDTRALVSTADGFGFLVSGELTPIPGLSDAINQLGPAAVQTVPDRSAAAVQVADGTVWRAQADGERTQLDNRPGLIAPTIDPQGDIWTVPQSTPADLHLVTPADQVQNIADAWPGASRILSMQLSRDGARLAAVLVYGGRSVVAVAGVVRDARGVPVALGEPEVLTTLADVGVAVGWVDEVTLGVLTGGEEPLYLDVPVGGPTTTIAAPSGARTLAGSTSAVGVRVLSADGLLYVRRASTWVQSASGVSVLAVQQGAPAASG